MKNTIIAALLLVLSLAVPALAAQQEITQISAVTASREALRTAVNTQLAAVQANFDEVYAVIDAGPVYTNTTAPADTKVVWIDTDQDNAIKVYVGGVWTVVGGGGSYTLPTAAADTLGGVKVGDRLSIADGVLSADIQTTDISGKENSLGNPSVTGYVLSSTTAGVRSWIEMTGGGTGIAHAPSDGNYYASKDGVWATLAGVFQPADADLTSAAGGSAAGNSKLFGTNSSGVVGWYDIPGEGSGIAHATADGKWYGSKDGAWVDLAPTFSSALPKWIDMSVGYTFTAGDLTWYNGQVWKASGTHSKVLGEYPDAESTDWEDYIQAPIVVDYPTEVGVPAWTAEGWAETSYTVGTAANNLVQLNASAQLPAVSGALLTNIPMPSWLPSAPPVNGRQVIQAVGGCSDATYDNQTDCETNSGTWTPPYGIWTSVIAGLINDLGAGVDDLWSAAKVSEGLSVKEDTTNKGAPNGYAGLDATGQVPASQLPEIAHATSDGNYYASRNGAWASLSGVFQASSGLLDDIAGLTPTANYLLGINSAGTDIELKSSLSIDVDLGVQSATAAGRLGRTTGDQVSMGNNAESGTVLFSPTDDTAGNGSTTRTWSADKMYDELGAKAGLIASGTASLGTAQIASGACATAVTETATGAATTDIVGWGFNGDPTSTTGYQASANGMLTIIAYPTSGNVNFRVCNNTAAAITPGSITLNWRVVR